MSTSVTTKPVGSIPANGRPAELRDRSSSDQSVPVRSPMREEEEWANAITHGFAALATSFLAVLLVTSAGQFDTGLAVACGVYGVSVFATFACSMASHLVRQQPLLNTLRSWDQAMIYAMIAGTYTPIIYHFAPDAVRTPLLIAVWVAAISGIVAKLILRHRINNTATITYLLLGWLPALPIANSVPTGLGLAMLLGGVIYSVGVLVLINDRRVKYMHVVWHLMVMAAALVHYLAVQHYVL